MMDGKAHFHRGWHASAMQAVWPAESAVHKHFLLIYVESLSFHRFHGGRLILVGMSAIQYSNLACLGCSCRLQFCGEVDVMPTVRISDCHPWRPASHG